MCNKINELYLLLDGQFLCTKFDIIFIRESWLDESINDDLLQCHYNDYSFLCFDIGLRMAMKCIFI